MVTMKTIRFFRKGFWVVLWSFLGIVVLFFGLAWALEYRPMDREEVYRSETPGRLPDTLTILTWNIGYAGLGDNMDFFYDGGTRVRDTRERTEANLEHIVAVLQATDADVMLLQEVDRCSKRTYRLSEVDCLQAAFPTYTLTFAYNYKARWVPIPVGRPLGRIESGLVMLSRVKPLRTLRLQYPSAFPFPERMFNLKRCLLAASFLSARGDTLILANTHNTAYDTGGMRTQEMQFLRDWLADVAADGRPFVVGGDWNQYPQGYVPRPEELTNPYFQPEGIDARGFEPWAHFVYDTLSPSLRYLDRPYGPESLTTLTDFFLLSDQWQVLSVQTLPEAFVASDHNPVLVRLARASR